MEALSLMRPWEVTDNFDFNLNLDQLVVSYSALCSFLYSYMGKELRHLHNSLFGGRPRVSQENRRQEHKWPVSYVGREVQREGAKAHALMNP